MKIRRDNRGIYALIFGFILLGFILLILGSNDLSDAIDTSLGIIDTATTVPVVGGGAALSRLGVY